tara:strand:+ start:346 stop:588 length:243 start_codon:yes stop_codon:yes gene_type:complete
LNNSTINDDVDSVQEGIPLDESHFPSSLDESKLDESKLDEVQKKHFLKKTLLNKLKVIQNDIVFHSFHWLCFLFATARFW